MTALEKRDAAKQVTDGAICLMRLGDFYEVFREDAKTIADACGLTVTKSRDGVPMAGFPYHQLDRYLAELIALGYRCAVCEPTNE